MTEADWFASSDPDAMLDFLQPNVTDRKTRLFACACCRNHWNWLVCNSSRRVVEEVERYADGSADHTKLADAKKEARRALRRIPDSHLYAAEAAASLASGRRIAHACRKVAALMRKQRGLWTPVPNAYRGRILEVSEHHAAKAAWDDACEAMEKKEGKQQTILLREILGNPFRHVALNPACFAPSVVSLAYRIYQMQSFDRLPELAVLLRHAGCAELELLAHCRESRDHVLGCWGLDLLLGKR
jgi:hypothetical protein